MTVESIDSTFAEGERVTLKPVAEGDFPFLREHENDPEVRRAMATVGPRTGADFRELLEDDGFHFVVCADTERVGYVALHSVDPYDGRGKLSYWVAPAHWGNNYATESIALVVEYAFAQLRLHKVIADVREFSEASVGVLEKLGFTREGRLRESRYVDGEYHDRYRFGLLQREWPGPSAALGE